MHSAWQAIDNLIGCQIRRLRGYASTTGYKLGWALVKLLPEPAARWIFNRVADAVARNPRNTEQLRRNLERIVGPGKVSSELLRESLRSYMRYWEEAFRLPRIHEDPSLLAQLERGVEGIEFLDDSIAKGHGVVLALTHSGNWDMAGVFLVAHHGSFTTVAERLKPESLFDAFVEYRESLGFNILAHEGGTRHPSEKLKQVLQNGGVVCLLSERDLRRTGVPVTFFGQEANMAAGPAFLAQQTGAALHAVHCFYREGEKARSTPWGFTITPALEVTGVSETTQRIAVEFEKFLQRRPQDWHMMQPVWNEDVARRRKLRADSRKPARKDRRK